MILPRQYSNRQSLTHIPMPNLLNKETHSALILFRFYPYKSFPFKESLYFSIRNTSRFSFKLCKATRIKFKRI